MSSKKTGSARQVPSGEYSTVAREREDGSFELVVEEIMTESSDTELISPPTSSSSSMSEPSTRRTAWFAAVALASIAAIWAAGFALTSGTRDRAVADADDAAASSSGFTPYDGSGAPAETPRRVRSAPKVPIAPPEEIPDELDAEARPIDLDKAAEAMRPAEITESEEIPADLLEEERRAKAAQIQAGYKEPTQMQREVMRNYQRARTKGLRIEGIKPQYNDIRTNVSPQLNSKLLEKIEQQMEAESMDENNLEKAVDERSGE